MLNVDAVWRNKIKPHVLMSEVKTSADTVLLWPAVWAPAPGLDLCPHWGQEESPGEPDWSQYEVMHCLQNQCPQLVETGSFRTSWHEPQQDDCSSSGTWLLLFLSLWRHFLITHMSQSQFCHYFCQGGFVFTQYVCVLVGLLVGL